MHPRQEGHNAANRAMGMVKVQWEHYGPEEATWELEDAMRLAHPFLFNFVEHRGGSSVAFLFNFCNALRIVLL